MIIFQLIFRYVFMPVIVHTAALFHGPGDGWNEKAKKWRNAIIGGLVLVYLIAMIWGGVTQAVNNFQEKARHDQLVREVQEDEQRHWVNGMYRE